MRRTAMTLNLIVVLFFAGFLAYTLVARQHLEGLARRYVTEKTLHYSEPIIEIADQALDTRVVQRLLTARQQGAIRHEIAEYRNDPASYIADLTRERVAPRNDQKLNPLLEKVVAIKQRIRAYYDKTLTALIVDLRIFAGSNLCAALIAIVLAYRSPRKDQKSLIWFSFFMLCTVSFCSSMYLDEMTFFRILLHTHMGWGYPVMLCVFLAGLYLDFGRSRSAAEQVPQPALKNAKA